MGSSSMSKECCSEGTFHQSFPWVSSFRCLSTSSSYEHWEVLRLSSPWPNGVEMHAHLQTFWQDPRSKISCSPWWEILCLEVLETPTQLQNKTKKKPLKLELPTCTLNMELISTRSSRLHWCHDQSCGITSFACHALSRTAGTEVWELWKFVRSCQNWASTIRPTVLTGECEVPETQIQTRRKNPPVDRCCAICLEWTIFLELWWISGNGVATIYTSCVRSHPDCCARRWTVAPGHRWPCTRWTCSLHSRWCKDPEGISHHENSCTSQRSSRQRSFFEWMPGPDGMQTHPNSA